MAIGTPAYSSTAEIETNTDATSYTSNADLTPLASDIIYIVVHGQKGGGANIPTVTGWGITFTQVADVAINATNRLTLFRGTGSNEVAGRWTVDYGATTHAGCLSGAYVIAGVDTGGTNGSNSVVQAVTASDTGTALLVTLAAFGNAANATLGFFSNMNGAGYTAGTGFTRHNTAVTTDLGRLCLEYQLANDTSVDATMASSGEWGGIAIEVKAAAVTGGPTGIRYLAGPGGGLIG